ncbi:MAG: nuclear transport factor 2 family protein [Kiloniellaceae bacterium]
MAEQQDIADLVRRYFGAYLSKQKEVLEVLLSEDFAFRCPLGNDIDRATYFQECWPGSAKIRAVDFESILTDGDEAMVRYVATLNSGAEYRCAEYFRAEGGRLVRVDVYFGNHPDHLFSIFEAAA